MATPAARMMLFKNGKSFPLNLLRGSLFVGSNNVTTQLISDPALLQPQQKPIFNMLGDQSNVGLGGDVNGVLNSRFGGFGKMGRVEAYGKRRVISDEDEEDDEDEFDSEEMEDFLDDEVDQDEDEDGAAPDDE